MGNETERGSVLSVSCGLSFSTPWHHLQPPSQLESRVRRKSLMITVTGMEIL